MKTYTFGNKKKITFIAKIMPEQWAECKVLKRFQGPEKFQGPENKNKWAMAQKHKQKFTKQTYKTNKDTNQRSHSSVRTKMELSPSKYIQNRIRQTECINRAFEVTIIFQK